MNPYQVRIRVIYVFNMIVCGQKATFWGKQKLYSVIANSGARLDEDKRVISNTIIFVIKNTMVKSWKAGWST